MCILTFPVRLSNFFVIASYEMTEAIHLCKSYAIPVPSNHHVIQTSIHTVDCHAVYSARNDMHGIILDMLCHRECNEAIHLLAPTMPYSKVCLLLWIATSSLWTPQNDNGFSPILAIFYQFSHSYPLTILTPHYSTKNAFCQEGSVLHTQYFKACLFHRINPILHMKYSFPVQK